MNTTKKTFSEIEKLINERLEKILFENKNELNNLENKLPTDVPFRNIIIDFNENDGLEINEENFPKNILIDMVWIEQKSKLNHKERTFSHTNQLLVHFVLGSAIEQNFYLNHVDFSKNDITNYLIYSTDDGHLHFDYEIDKWNYFFDDVIKLSEKIDRAMEFENQFYNKCEKII